ncbi:MAG: TolC family protein [bacterium]|nr:TolC family protein [bacterium]
MRIVDASKSLIVLSLLTVVMVTQPCFAIKEKAKKDKTQQNQEIQIEETEKKLVGKISFDDVVKKAEEHAYDLKIADYNILIAKQDIRGARSEYFPKLNFMAGTEYTRNFQDIKDTTIMSISDAFINPYTRFQSILGITVMYNLFDFGVRSCNLKIAKEDTALKELEVKQKFQEMNLTLLDSYAKILITTKQIELNEEILKLQEKNLEMKERLYEAKEISKTDLNDAKAEVAKTKYKISDLKSVRGDSLNWLSFYTGEQYDTNNLKVEVLKKSDFDVLEFQDYTKSVIWKIHEKNIKKKELEVSAAKRNYLPKVNAYGRYYLYGSNYSNYGKALGIKPSNLSVGASLNMPIFDGFKNSSIVQKAELELKQLQVERDKAIAELMTRLASMRSNLIYLDEQINENSKAISELTDKEKSIHKLVANKVSSPVEENEAKIELLNQKIELEKSCITQNALKRGIQILTEEY